MVIVVGAGLTGCAAARALAERGRDVLLLDKKPRVGGACYDYPDGQGAYIHKYGPHTFHTNSEKVYGFISRFSRWNNFTYRVLGDIKGKLCPIPFNFTSIETCFSPSAAEEYKSRLSGLIGFGGAAAIGTLLSADDGHLKRLARFIYENVFLEYTKKQWGMPPEELGGGVMSRVPVRASYDDGYFADKYELIPSNGYTSFMENMLAHPNISLETGVDADARLSVDGGVLSFDGERFEDAVIYTGSLDKLMRYKYGALPYRTLDFVTKKTAWPFQPVAVVNYPDSRPYTRTMESGHFYPGNDYNFSRVTYEYPLAYEPDSDREPYYPIPSERGAEIYKLYMNDASAARNFYPAGRLGGYRYINMDAAVLDGLAAAEKAICKN